MVDDPEEDEVNVHKPSGISGDKDGRGKLRKLRLSEAIRQQEDMEQRRGGQKTDGSSGKLLGLAGIGVLYTYCSIWQNSAGNSV